MGQYHILVNVDKREMVEPWDLALGSKQWEHTGDFRYPLVGSLADAMYILTMTSPNRGGGDLPQTTISGNWAGDRVMIVGDYTEDSDLPAEFLGAQLYETALDSYTNISPMVRDAFTTVFGIQWEAEESQFTPGRYMWSRKVPTPETV